MQHVIGSIELGFQLFHSTLLQGRFSIRKKAQIDHVTFLKTLFNPLCICIFLFLVLGLLYFIFQCSQHVLLFLQKIMSLWSPTIINQHVNKAKRLIPIQSHKRGYFYGHVVWRIVAKISQMQPFHLCALLPWNIFSQVPFQPFVHNFPLAIYLRVIINARS